jgi:TorA maturation chaperone TorD
MELLRALAALAEPPSAESARLAALLDLGTPSEEAAWTELFALQLPPYASIYLSADGRMGGEARDRVAGFWRAVGLLPPAEPDHLPLMLAFQAQLAERETRATLARDRTRWRSVRRAFFGEHLASWLPYYLAALAEEADEFHLRWSELLARALDEESAAIGPLPGEPAHFRDLPALRRPGERGVEEGDDWLGDLLAPLRCGFFLPRAALRRAARELGLGERMGERRLTLRTLLSQDGDATLVWLAARARAAAVTHARAGSSAPQCAAFWSARAEASANLLDALAEDARRV